MRKNRKISVVVTFDAPYVDFSEIRDFITDWLESGGGNRHPNDPLFHSLHNVHVSKPITVWRDPKRKKTAEIHIIPNDVTSSGKPIDEEQSI